MTTTESSSAAEPTNQPRIVEVKWVRCNCGASFPHGSIVRDGESLRVRSKVQAREGMGLVLLDSQDDGSMVPDYDRVLAEIESSDLPEMTEEDELRAAPARLAPSQKGESFPVANLTLYAAGGRDVVVVFGKRAAHDRLDRAIKDGKIKEDDRERIKAEINDSPLPDESDVDLVLEYARQKREVEERRASALIGDLLVEALIGNVFNRCR